MKNVDAWFGLAEKLEIGRLQIGVTGKGYTIPSSQLAQESFVHGFVICTRIEDNQFILPQDLFHLFRDLMIVNDLPPLITNENSTFISVMTQLHPHPRFI